MNLFQQLGNRVRLLVATGVMKLVDDGRKVQQLQCAVLSGEVRSNLNRMQDYGFTSVPLAGAEVLLVSVGGNRNHMVAVKVDDGRYRKRNLAPGEVAVYHHSGSYLLMKADGTIEMQASLVKVNGNLTATGTITGNQVKTQSGIDLSTHTHGGVQTGGGNTGPAQ